MKYSTKNSITKAHIKSHYFLCPNVKRMQKNKNKINKEFFSSSYLKPDVNPIALKVKCVKDKHYLILNIISFVI